MGLVHYAESELQLAGLFDKDSDYNGEIAKAVMTLIEIVAKQGHSGGSIHIMMEIFQRLVRFKPLTPLTGEDDEWLEASPGVWQNKRCFNVFKQADRFNGQPYDIDKLDADGNSMPITFPYMPE